MTAAPDVAVHWELGSDRPREDHGFFGPDSPTWKVWTSPTALIGFQRSVVLEHFEPHLAAAVADAAGIYRDPRGRMDGTLAYFLIVATADSRTAVEASEHLQKVHARSKGIDPVTGTRYSANDPASQLWIHVTGWHSVLKCYEVFGPGPLSRAEEDRYWSECVIAAELQTVNPAEVPRSRDEVRQYFARMRPTLCTSERAQRAMHYLLRTPRSGSSNMQFWAISRLLAPATIATLPRWMRELGQFDQPGIVDAAYRPLVSAGMRIAGIPAVETTILRRSLPMTRTALRDFHNAKAPLRPVTVTPAEAKERYGRRATA